jgi:glc operon protein GlcG
MSAHSVRILASLTATMTLAAAFPALAIELPTKPYLTLEAARSVVAAAEKEATANGWPCVISPGKARTAALFRRESGALEDAINGARPAAITARGFVLMRGGVPITVNGTIVGAIGVSADTPDHDQQIAKAGAAALTIK